jgi:preprotein translocase subunit SecF
MVFNVVGKKWLWFAISLLLIVPGVVFLLLGGLKPGIDFTGGSQLELQINGGRNVVEALQAQAKTEHVDLKSVVPAADSHYLLKFQSLSQAQQSNFVQHLNSGLAPTQVVSFTSVGPTISGTFSWVSVLHGIALPLRLFGVNVATDNISQAIGGVVWASVAIALYIAYAFRKVPKPYSPWAFGVSAIVALLHDALLVLGLFAILGYFFDIEIDTSFVTAVLTVIGFSVHDTIVVFDRVRENLHRHPEMTFSQVVNVSVMETLDRSISTSLTVVLVLASLFLLGGSSIRWFVFALLVGIISGTYSSIFNASMILDIWEERRSKPKAGKKAKEKKVAQVTAEAVG